MIAEMIKLLDESIAAARAATAKMEALKARLAADPTIDTAATDAAEAEHLANLPDEGSDR